MKIITDVARLKRSLLAGNLINLAVYCLYTNAKKGILKAHWLLTSVSLSILLILTQHQIALGQSMQVLSFHDRALKTYYNRTAIGRLSPTGDTGSFHCADTLK